MLIFVNNDPISSPSMNDYLLICEADMQIRIAAKILQLNKGTEKANKGNLMSARA